MSRRVVGFVDLGSRINVYAIPCHSYTRWNARGTAVVNGRVQEATYVVALFAWRDPGFFVFKLSAHVSFGPVHGDRDSS